MLDKDGIERPDSADEHIREVKDGKRKVKFDQNYPFRVRNVFFRVWSSIFRAMAICVFNPYMFFSRGLVTFGGENKKKLRGKGFVITCNHVHILDDLSIGTNVFCWRKIYFTTLDRNIKISTIGFFLRSLGGIPIPTDSIGGIKKFNSDISYLIQRNKPVLFNPEAALWPFYREIRPFKRGAFQTAVRNDVPVLPIVALFRRKKKRNGKFKYRISFAICKPVYADKTLGEREASEKLMKEVYETSKRVAEEWYALQDCGFEDEVGLPKLNPKKEISFIDDHWVVNRKTKTEKK